MQSAACWYAWRWSAVQPCCDGKSKCCGANSGVLIKLCPDYAVTRNKGEASGPAVAPAEDAPPDGLGDLVVDQPDQNATDTDVLPSPEPQDVLPPGGV